MRRRGLRSRPLRASGDCPSLSSGIWDRAGGRLKRRPRALLWAQAWGTAGFFPEAEVPGAGALTCVRRPEEPGVGALTCLPCPMLALTCVPGPEEPSVGDPTCVDAPENGADCFSREFVFRSRSLR